MEKLAGSIAEKSADAEGGSKESTRMASVALIPFSHLAASSSAPGAKTAVLLNTERTRLAMVAPSEALLHNEDERGEAEGGAAEKTSMVNARKKSATNCMMVNHNFAIVFLFRFLAAADYSTTVPSISLTVLY